VNGAQYNSNTWRFLLDFVNNSTSFNLILTEVATWFVYLNAAGVNRNKAAV